MTRPRVLVALALVGFGLTCPTLAAAQALPLTLDDAIERGVAASPKLREIQAREAAATATREARTALNRPTLSTMSSYVRTNHVDEYAIRQPDGSSRVLYPDIPDNLRVRAEMLWPVWTSGRVGALVASATADADAVAADARAAKADVTLEVTQAYWTLVTAREAVDVIKAGLDRMDAWVSDVRARLDAGLVSPHELLMAQAQRARDQVRRIQAEQAVVVAERELARLTGVTGQAIIPTSPVAQARPGIDQLTARAVPDVVEQAQQVRPEQEAFALRRASFRAMAEAAMAATRPQVAALAALEPARPNSRFFPREAKWHASWDLGVTVTWSLWDGGRAKADRATAEAQMRALDARQDDFEARVAVDVQARLGDIVSGRAAVAASNEAVAAAAEAHRVLQERYAAGVATSTDVLDAQVAWLEAALERTRLQAALRMSEALLQRVAGVQ